MKPRPGQVIRYAYLWKDEARAGQEEGLKDRPCAVILSVDEPAGTRVAVLPITHVPPKDPDDALEIPATTKRRLGMDDGRSWIVLSEANLFRWPGPDLRPLPGQGLDSVLIGLLPAALYRQVRDRFVARWKRRTAQAVNRSE